MGQNRATYPVRPQLVIATASANACEGVIQPKVCRGLVLGDRAMVSSSRCVICERSVGLGRYWRSNPFSVLVRSALPRSLGIADVDLHTGVDRELDVLGHLLALVPGDRTANLDWERADALGHRIAHGLGAMAVRQLHEHQITTLAFDEGADGGQLLAEDEVSFPVPRYGSVVGLRRSLQDHDDVA